MGLTLDWLKDDQRLFMKRGYLREGETPEQRFGAICAAIQRICDKQNMQSGSEWDHVRDIGKRFEHYISNGWVSFATPVLRNFGAPDNLPISCNHSIIEDSLDGIYSGLHETGMLAKNGAGTAVNFSDIRPEGSNISSGGKSNSVLDWVELYADMISKTAQNAQRRGFLTAYLSLDHPEIMDFLDIGTERMPTERKRFFNTITTAVIIPDGWRDDLRTNKQKRKVFTKLLNTRKEIGYPYILDEHNANKGICQAYIDKGMRVKSSNICVTGDQRVVTDRGYLTAKELYESGEDLIVFDNKEPVMASSMRLIQKDADVFTVTLKNGMSHTITQEHKLKVLVNGKYKDVECKDLQLGDRVFIQTNQGLFGIKNAPQEAFLLGLWQGDGSRSGNSINIDIWKNDFDLIPIIQEIHDTLLEKYQYKQRYANKGGKFIDVPVRETSEHTKKGLTSDLYSKIFDFQKGVVPYWIWEGDEQTQWNYLKGLLYSDGSAYKSKITGKLKNSVIQIALASTNKKFLQEIQLIMNNLGLHSTIKYLQKKGKSLLPDSAGILREYETNDCFRLIVSNLNDALKIEKNTGFLSRKNISIDNRIYRDNTKKAHAIVSIEHAGKEDVYCLNVFNESHHWICNGFVTHNCIEAMEYSDYEKTFACCLSSVNLYYFDQFKNDPDFIFDMNIMLDCVIEEYIEKGQHLPGLGRAIKFAKEHRAIGLGVTGFHTYLQMNMIAFGSMESFQKNYEIFSLLRRESDRASREMAAHWGEPEVLKGYGERNTSRMAQAPKKSTTFIDGGTWAALSEGIEPHKSNLGEKKLAKIQTTFRNKELEKLLVSKGMNTKKVWDSIIDRNGSVQHLEFLDQHEKDVFKIFSEVSQVDVIKLAAQRQQFIDMGQSINIMVHPDTPAKDVINLHLLAFDEGLKSLYYQYSINAAQKFSQELLTCSTCEG